MIDQHIIICVGIDHTTHGYPDGYFDHSVAHFRKLYTPLGLAWWVFGWYMHTHSHRVEWESLAFFFGKLAQPVTVLFPRK
jgi:hypothetical protein